MLMIEPESPDRPSPREFLRIVALALRLAWQAGRRETLTIAVLQLVQAAGLAVLLLLSQRVVEDVLAGRGVAGSGGARGRDRRDRCVLRLGGARAAAVAGRALRAPRALAGARRGDRGRAHRLGRRGLPRPPAARPDGPDAGAADRLRADDAH